ncbi:MAG TPA: cation:dicarboxylase symporter family transporter, partial [Gammaproteobacteria bacterium]|nr:cation:dicarboxylase symporter family transporter [Gammaproteobacteria bacterium]
FLIGTYDKMLAESLAPMGELYLALLGMCILPIIVTALISSVGKSLHTAHLADLMKHLALLLFVGLMIACVLGIMIALLVQPGTDLSAAGKAVLSNKVTHVGTESLAVHSSGILNFLLEIVPANIFHALSQGHTLSVVFFAILLGVALGKITTDDSKKTLAIVHVLYTAFLKIVTWIMYALPLGLCFLFAGYAAKISWEEMSALGNLLLAIYGGSIVLAIICSILIWQKSNTTYARAIAALKGPLLVAFGSCSSLASIPAMINGLEQRLHLERGFAELVIPLGVNLFRLGTVLRFVITALFIAQLYDQPLTLIELGILAFAAMLASLAVSGLPGIASASIFALVLQPLGLPSGIGMILFIAILPITEPIVTLLNVQGNCTLAMLMRPSAKPKSG